MTCFSEMEMKSNVNMFRLLFYDLYAFFSKPDKWELCDIKKCVNESQKHKNV